MANIRTLTIGGVTYDLQDNVSGYVTTDESVKQLSANAPSYSYWRPLPVGDSSSSTEGFSPATKTGSTYTFPTLQAQPSTGTIRMGKASFFNGSYTHKVSPTTLTANRTATLPDKSGTIAFTDDIPPVVNDLGNIDPSEYDDDIETFFNTLLDDGIYRFVFEDGDDFEYYVVVESLVEDGNGYVYQKYWYTEEGSKIIYHRSLQYEDGELVDSNTDNYLTLNEANSMFASSGHNHYESVSKAMSVWDFCNSSDLTFNNAKPFLIYKDTLNDENWLIERYIPLSRPADRFIRVTALADASAIYQRSGLYNNNAITWGQWKTYPSNSVTDVLVNNSSVVNNGIASLPTIPSKTSDLTNDSGFITGYTETDPTVPAWAKASTKPSYNFSEIGSTPTTISGYGLTDAYTKTEVDNLLLALPEPMLFKGSLGTGGTITTLPAAAAANEGFVYKVITDGTYASQTAKIGDTFISDGSTWVLIPSGDEPSGTVISVGLSNATNGGLTISGSPITSSGTLTVGHSNILASAQTTSGIYPIKIDKNGHISEYGSAVTIPSITLNGSSSTSPSFYAPTTAGTSGYVLTSSGSGAPSWSSIPTENMIVTVTRDPYESYSADKSYAEIVAALSAGKNVTCVYDDNHHLNDIYDASDDSGVIKFSGLTDLNDVYIITFWDDDAISFESYTVPSITLNGSATAYPSFYAPTSAGTSGQVLTSSGSGAPTWAAAPTVPTITLNGNSTTSPSFYAPTSAGTNGYVLQSSGSGAPSWISATLTDEKVKAESASDNTVYYPVMGGSNGNAETKKYSLDLRFDKEDNDFAELQIGNSSEQGFLVLGDGDNHYAHIYPNYPLTGDRSISIPDKDGQLALTSDIPTNTSDLNNDSGFITTSTFGDYITEYGQSGNWQYQKYASGRIVMEGYYTFPSLTFSASGNIYRSTGNAFTIPSGVFTDSPTHGEAWIQGSDTVYMGATVGGLTTTGGNCQLFKSTSGSGSNVSVHIRLIQKGTIT